MKKDKRIYKINPGFCILSGDDLLKDNPAIFDGTFENNNDLYLTYDGKCGANDLLPVDLPTANFLLSVGRSSDLDQFIERPFNRLLVDELLFDNILQVNSDEKFIGGVAWSRAGYASHVSGTRHTKNAQTSCNAISYAWHFRSDSLPDIEKRLYLYGTMPNQPSISDHTDTPKNFINWLGSGAIKLLKSSYDKQPISKQNFWHYWQNKKKIDVRSLRYKLYISPKPAETPAVFEKVCKLCAGVTVPAFKIGADTQGINRPDKLVLYFSNEDDLRLFASLIIKEIDKFPAQIVPFAYPLTESGILSFGIEPDQSNNISYRIFVSKLIARSIKACSFHCEQFDLTHHLKRLCIHGIDTNRWNTFNLNYGNK